MKVVYSTEEARKPISGESDAQSGKQIPASISFVPPVAGFIAAGEVIRDIIGIERS